MSAQTAHETRLAAARAQRGPTFRDTPSLNRDDTERMRPGDRASFLRAELVSVQLLASSADCDPYPYFRVSIAVWDASAGRWQSVRVSDLVRHVEAAELYNAAVLWSTTLRRETARRYAGWFSRHRGRNGGQLPHLARIPHICAVCHQQVMPGRQYLRDDAGEPYHADYRECVRHS